MAGRAASADERDRKRCKNVLHDHSSWSVCLRRGSNANASVIMWSLRLIDTDALLLLSIIIFQSLTLAHLRSGVINTMLWGRWRGRKKYMREDGWSFGRLLNDGQLSVITFMSLWCSYNALFIHYISNLTLVILINVWKTCEVRREVD